MTSSQPRPRVAVVGAGVIGLSAAVCLAETYGRQLDITVIAEHFSPNTTSDRAGATIMPFSPVADSSASNEVKQHDQILARWSKTTLDYCKKLHSSTDCSSAGVFLTPCRLSNVARCKTLPFLESSSPRL